MVTSIRAGEIGAPKLRRNLRFGHQKWLSEAFDEAPTSPTRMLGTCAAVFPTECKWRCVITFADSNLAALASVALKIDDQIFRKNLKRKMVAKEAPTSPPRLIYSSGHVGFNFNCCICAYVGRVDSSIRAGEGGARLLPSQNAFRPKRVILTAKWAPSSPPRLNDSPKPGGFYFNPCIRYYVGGFLSALARLAPPRPLFRRQN